MMAWKETQMNDSELCSIFEADKRSETVETGKGATREKAIHEGEEEEFRVEKVMCSSCKEIIGTCDMSKFEAPMHGSIFLGKDNKHGYPPPFYMDFEYHQLKCPVCNRPPFRSPNWFENQRGEHCGLTIECPDCGKGFKNSQGLVGHKPHCEKPIRRN